MEPLNTDFQCGAQMWYFPHSFHIFVDSIKYTLGRIEIDTDSPFELFPFRLDIFERIGTDNNISFCPKDQGNNPMVGMTVSVAVAVEESLKG